MNGGLSDKAQSGTFKTKKIEFDVMFLMFLFISNEFKFKLYTRKK
jgi:hypothetical protein